MASIRKEIPTGVIDGVNKVFTLLNTPDFIDDLWYDGAIYTDFTLDPSDPKIITLNDAPLITIFVDYETGATQSQVSTDCTFGDIKDKVWLLLGQKSTSTNFSDAIIGKEINFRAEEIWKGRVVNKLNAKQIYRAGKLYFRDLQTNVRIQSGSTVVEPFNVGATEIDMDTEFLLGAGFVEIGGENIKYTSTSATQLLGVSGQTINHLAEEKVVQLYEMPVNMDKPSIVEFVSRDKDARKVPIPLDNTDSFAKYFRSIRFEDGKTLLKIVGFQQDDLVKVSYVKNYQELSLNTDKCPFPEQYSISVLAFIVAGGLGYDKGIPNSQQWLNSGYTSLQTMYGDFNDITNIVVQSVRPQSYGFRSIRGRRRGFGNRFNHNC